MEKSPHNRWQLCLNEGVNDNGTIMDLFVRKIVEKTFVNPHTKLEETKAVITFCTYSPAVAIAGMSLGMPEDAKYGNVFLHSETLEDAKANYTIGANYGEWLELSATAVEGYPNLYKVLMKTQTPEQ